MRLPVVVRRSTWETLQIEVASLRIVRARLEADLAKLRSEFDAHAKLGLQRAHILLAFFSIMKQHGVMASNDISDRMIHEVPRTLDQFLTKMENEAHALRRKQ